MSERSKSIPRCTKSGLCVCVCLSVCVHSTVQTKPPITFKFLEGMDTDPTETWLVLEQNRCSHLRKNKENVKKSRVIIGTVHTKFRSHSIFLWAYILIYHRLLEFLNKIGAAVFPKKNTFWESPKHGFLDAQYFTYKLLFTVIWKFIGSRHTWLVLAESIE